MMTAQQLELFWEPLIVTECAGMLADRFWGSVRKMAQEVDVVVLGRPVATLRRWSSGSTLQPPQVVVVEIDEVIRGDPVTRDDGRIELEIFHGGQPHSVAGLPANRHLFFLRSVADRNYDYGLGVSEVDRYSYVLPSLYQNILVESDGFVFVPAVERVRAERDNNFPSNLHGRRFTDVLTAVRDAVVSDVPNEVLGSMRFAC